MNNPVMVRVLAGDVGEQTVTGAIRDAYKPLLPIRFPLPPPWALQGPTCPSGSESESQVVNPVACTAL